MLLPRHADVVGGEGLVKVTETLPGVSPDEKTPKRAGKAAAGATERAAVRELVRAARARGDDLTGQDGLLKVITAIVLESALEEEMSEHLGFDRHQGSKDGGNIRNGTRARTVLTDAAGEVVIQVPRDPGRHVRAADRPEADERGVWEARRWTAIEAAVPQSSGALWGGDPPGRVVLRFAGVLDDPAHARAVGAHDTHAVVGVGALMAQRTRCGWPSGEKTGLTPPPPATGRWALEG